MLFLFSVYVLKEHKVKNGTDIIKMFAILKLLLLIQIL